jgi:hypothetical protein
LFPAEISQGVARSNYDSPLARRDQTPKKVADPLPESAIKPQADAEGEGESDTEECRVYVGARSGRIESRHLLREFQNKRDNEG